VAGTTTPIRTSRNISTLILTMLGERCGLAARQGRPLIRENAGSSAACTDLPILWKSTNWCSWRQDACELAEELGRERHSASCLPRPTDAHEDAQKICRPICGAAVKFISSYAILSSSPSWLFSPWWISPSVCEDALRGPSTPTTTASRTDSRSVVLARRKRTSCNC
jgi:hypothetical protein